MFRNLIAACLAGCTALSAPAAFAEETKIPRTISLAGHGEAHVAPDLAIVTVGVVKQAATASEALAASPALLERWLGAAAA